jgi:acetyl esterase/lipase
LDPERIILVGDSAGAQLASQYAAIHTDPGYASLFGLKQDKVRIRALGLNCGLYDMAKRGAEKRKGLFLDYLGKEIPADDPRLDVLGAITNAFPPAYITTAHNDFLREEAEPMFRFLTGKGISCGWKCYGAPEKKEIGHVFHVNILLPEAIACNDDAAAFFRKYV